VTEVILDDRSPPFYPVSTVKFVQSEAILGLAKKI
jgi:hypothetical protein